MFLASNTVAMVTYCVTKMITTCSPMIGWFFGTMIVVSSEKSVCNDPSVLEPVASHLKLPCRMEAKQNSNPVPKPKHLISDKREMGILCLEIVYLLCA